MQDETAKREQYRETLQAMSDEAIAYQLENGARGGIQREEIEREAARRNRESISGSPTKEEQLAYDLRMAMVPDE